MWTKKTHTHCKFSGEGAMTKMGRLFSSLWKWSRTQQGRLRRFSVARVQSRANKDASQSEIMEDNTARETQREKKGEGESSCRRRRRSESDRAKGDLRFCSISALFFLSVLLNPHDVEVCTCTGTRTPQITNTVLLQQAPGT